MKKYLLLVGLCLLASNLIYSQSESLSGSPLFDSNRTEMKTVLPAAYSNPTTTISSETTTGIQESTIQIDLREVDIPMTSSTAPFANRPEGFGENLLYINGPVESQSGLSVLESSLGMTSYGYNVNAVTDYQLADDFVLHGDYDISSIDVYSYQTGEQPPSITKAYIQIWDGDPSSGGSVIWGDMNTDRIDGVADTGIYRIDDADPTDTSRKVQRVTINTNGLNLSAGSYWLSIALAGSGSSGPWALPISVLGETFTGNAIQLSSGNWQALVDDGTGDPQGIPFEIYGTSSGDCQEINPPYDWHFEEGYRIATSSSSMTANDITVDAGTNFTLNNVIVYIISQWPITEADITYYDDDNGLPGTEIGSENNVTIANSNAIGSAFGYNVYFVELEITPFELEGQENNTTTYWIQIDAENSHDIDVYWAGRYEEIIGNSLANKGAGNWEHPQPDLDGVYIFSGECEDILGVENHELSQFTAYPNPTTGILTIESQEKIESVQVYNLLGQQVMSQPIGTSNTQIDLSGLQRGVYLLKAKIEDKVETFKVIKN